MKILNFNSKVALAPMAGITDLPMRKMITSFVAPDKQMPIIFSEMVAINAINRRNPKTYRIADVRGEAYPVIVQLVGGEPELFSEAVKLAEELGAYSIDINMGCPVGKIVRNNSGCELMKKPKVAAKIIESCVKASPLKVSVKFRKGWDNNHINAVEFAKMCEESGASFVSLHGRTRSQLYSGQADWDIIAEVKQAVKIPVIGNGDITSPQKAKAMLDYTNADAVMIGRGALGSPWLISQTEEYLQTGIEPTESSRSFIKQTLIAHIKELVAYYGERLAIPISRKYVCWYCKNMLSARKFRENYMKITTFQAAEEEIENFFTDTD